LTCGYENAALKGQRGDGVAILAFSLATLGKRCGKTTYSNALPERRAQHRCRRGTKQSATGYKRNKYSLLAAGLVCFSVFIFINTFNSIKT
jgi:hypothetical protein